VDEAAFVGSRVLAMSTHPGRIALDEPVPFGKVDRATLRSTLEFVEFRDHLSRVIRAAAG
jgi:ABC-type nitrate/sulfonate/bicarbonate transport system ATPase subunit